MVVGRGGQCLHHNRCLCLQGQRLRWRGGGGGGGGGDGDRRRVVVAGKDSCSAATTLPIGAPCPSAWIFRCELISRALGDGGTGGSGGSVGGSGGGVSIGKGSWSLARAVVCVVMGAIGKVFPTKIFFTGASFSSRCHHTTLHGNSFLPTPT